MIGPLLNICNKIDHIVKKYSSTAKLCGTYGFGVKDAVVNGTMTNEQLFNRYGTLEFHDLTVTEGSTLMPAPSFGGGKGCQSLKNIWHPMIIKCSGTLTVDGTITTGNAGSRWYFWDDHNVVSVNTFEIPFPTPSGDYGYSIDSKDYIRLLNFGGTRGFLNSDFFLVGGSGGGNHHYHTGSIHKRWHNEHSRNKGINWGGGTSANGHNFRGGSAGGFLCLYYKNLIINNREYGIDSDCDISKVSANGIKYSHEHEHAGGCMVISARNIIIGKNGSINSNAENKTGEKFCYLNNLPKLSGGQTGLYMASDGSICRGTPSSNIYYYKAGLYGDIRSVESSTDCMCGGAGIALGFKVDE